MLTFPVTVIKLSGANKLASLKTVKESDMKCNFPKSNQKGTKSIKFILVYFIMIIFAVNIHASSFNGEVKVNVRKITSNVVILNIEGLQATNVIAVNSSRGIVVIDTETTPVFASAIRKKIEEEFPGKNILYLINTHDHPDHTYGNQVFADVPIIGHENCLEQMKDLDVNAANLVKRISASLPMLKKRLETLEKGSDASENMEKTIAYYSSIAEGLKNGFKVKFPDITFNKEMTLNLGDISLQLKYYGYSHSRTDIIIYCPEEKFLATGDIFYAGGEPYFDSERIPYIPMWKETLRFILSRKNDIEFVLPGHGELLPISDLENYAKLVNERSGDFEGKESALFVFKEIYEKEGAEPAVKKLKEMAGQKEKCFILHPEFDTFAYRLMRKNELKDALEIFLFLAEMFPDKPNAFDSLGEVYLRLDEKEKALKNFKRVLELDPNNANAKAKIAQLEK